MRTLLLLALLLTPACLTQCDGVGAIGSMRQGAMNHGAARGDMTPPADGDAAPTPPGSPSWWMSMPDEAYADGAAVSTIHDLGSLAKDATQGTAGARATFATPCESGKLEDLACATFDGGDWYQVAYATSLAQPNLICSVANYGATVGVTEIVYDGDDGSNRNELIGYTATNHAINGGTILAGPPNSAAANRWDMVCATFNGGSSGIRVNGSSVATGAGGAHAMDGVTIGAAFSGAAAFLTGKIAEVIVYDTAPAGGAADVEAYFVARYGSFPQ